MLEAAALVSTPDADWPMVTWPWANVGGLMSTRAGGVSQAPWSSMNLGAAVGDDAAHVAENRLRFARALDATPVFLRQVHGVAVLRLMAEHLADDIWEADACVTTEVGLACTIQVADCLPVLFAAPDHAGQRAAAVGAAHAGWRGLAGGVLEATLQRVCELAGCAPDQVVTWLGACIGPQHFEVGADVLLALGADPASERPVHFARAMAAADGSPRWMADLSGLARDRLAAAGVRHISGLEVSTVGEPSRFFSYRRDHVTGRMAAAVWLRR